MADETVTVEMKGETSSLVHGFNEVAKATTNVLKGIAFVSHQYRVLQNNIESAGNKLIGIGVGMAASLGAVSFAGAQLEASLLNVMTVSNDVNTNMNSLLTTTLDFSTQLRQSSTEVAESLYDITSAGYDAAEATQVVDAAARSASAGLTDTSTSARAITSLLQAYNLSAGQAAQVSDTLFQTVNVGVVTFQELAGGVGEWAAIASQVGVSMAEAGAAIATMTRAGTSAGEAITQLSRLMTSFTSPTQEMTAAFNRAGYATAQAALKALGLEGALKVLRQAAGSNLQMFDAFFGRIEATNAALQLTNNGGRTFGEMLDNLQDSTKVAGATQRALAIQSQGLGYQMALLRNRAAALSQLFAQGLVPVAKAAVNVMNQFTLGTYTLARAVEAVVPGSNTIAKTLGAIASSGTVVAVIAGLVLRFKAMALALAILNKIGLTRVLHGWLISLQTAFMNSALGARVAQTSIFKFVNFAKASVGIVSTLSLAITALTVALALSVGHWQEVNQAAKQAVESLTGQFDKNNFDLESWQKGFGDVRKNIVEMTKATEDWGEGLSISDKTARQLKRAWEWLPGTKNTLSAAEETVNQLTAREKQMGEQALNMAKNFQQINFAMAAWQTDTQFVGKNMKQITEQLVIAQIKQWELAQGGKLTYQQQQLISAELNNQVVAFSNLLPGAQDHLMTLEDLGKAAHALGLEIDLTQPQEIPPEVIQSIFQWVAENKLLTASQKTMNTLMAVFGDVTKDANDRIKALQDSMEGLFTVLDFRASIGKLSTAMRAFVEDVKALRREGVGGSILDPTTEAGAKVAEDLQSVKSGYIAAASAAYASTGKIRSAVDFANEYNASLINMLKSANLTTEEIRILYNEMALTPEQLQTYLKLEGTEATREALSGVQNQMAQVDGTKVTTTVDVKTTYDGKPADTRFRAKPGTQVNPDDVRNLPGVKDLQSGLASIDFSTPAESASRQANIEDALFAAGKINTERYIQLLKSRMAALDTWSVEYTKTLLDMEKLTADQNRRLYDNEQMTTQEYIATLQDRQKGLEKYSEEWNNIQNEIKDVLDKAVEKQKKSLQDLADVQQRMFQSGNIGADAYLAFLRKRLAGLAKFSDEWISTWQEIQSVEEDQKTKAEELAQEQVRLQEAMFNAGAINSSQYLAALRSRLAGLKKFSEEWVDTWEKIRDVEKSILEAGAANIKAASEAGVRSGLDVLRYMAGETQALGVKVQQEAKQQGKATVESVNDYLESIGNTRGARMSFLQRSFNLGIISKAKYLSALRAMLGSTVELSDAWFDVQEAIKSVEEAVDDEAKRFTDPIKQATDMMANLSDQGKVTTDDIVGYFAHMTEAASRWQTAINTLNTMGLNKDLLQQLAEQGPQALGLAESLVQGGAASISAANKGFGDLTSIIGKTGGQFTALFPKAQQSFTTNIKVDSIDLAINAPAQVTKTDVEAVINTAFNDLSNKVSANKVK